MKPRSASGGGARSPQEFVREWTLELRSSPRPVLVWPCEIEIPVDDIGRANRKVIICTPPLDARYNQRGLIKKERRRCGSLARRRVHARLSRLPPLVDQRSRSSVRPATDHAHREVPLFAVLWEARGLGHRARLELLAGRDHPRAVPTSARGSTSTRRVSNDGRSSLHSR